MKFQTASGKEIHPIGIGTWGIGGTFDAARGHEAAEIEAIRYGLINGQNHIDTAQLYGGGYTDEIVGRALEGKRRQDLFIADKLWKTSVAKGKVRPELERMLKKLRTDYLDLLYIHWPWGDSPWVDAVPQINDLIDDGLVRHFGVSNFDAAQMQQAQSASKHPIAANQLLYNVINQNQVPDSVSEYCNEHDVAIVAYRPVERSAVANNKTVQEVARAHDATAAQIALAWLLAKGALPIPKAVQKRHIDENLGAIGLRLTDGELNQLDAL